MIYFGAIIYFLGANTVLLKLENKNEIKLMLTMICSTLLAYYLFSFQFALLCLGVWMVNFLGMHSGHKDICIASWFRRKYGIIFVFIGTIISIIALIMLGIAFFTTR